MSGIPAWMYPVHYWEPQDRQRCEWPHCTQCGDELQVEDVESGIGECATCRGIREEDCV